MPSEAEPEGKLCLDLAPGDYLVTGACAGVYGAKLTVIKADGVPEAASFECDAPLDRFVRHDGGPLTVSAVPPTGRPAATGVKVQTGEVPLVTPPPSPSPPQVIPQTALLAVILLARRFPARAW